MTTPSPTTTASARPVKAVIGACAGNVVEWFDFLLYGLTATILAATFFPGDNDAAKLTATFGVYAVAFLARPFGAIVFGRLGDRVGRRRALTWSVLLMGLSTALIGVLPGYASIGWLAPVLLLACRLVQGVSAGGEFAGALTFALEHVAPDKLGVWLGVVASSTWIGSLAATLTLLGLLLGGAGPNAWRYAFVAGGVLALVGLYIRSRLEETPEFTRMKEEGEVSKSPLRDAMRGGKRLVAVLAFFAFTSVLGHLAVGYLPTHLAVTAGLKPVAVLTAMAILFAMIALLAPLAGRLCDVVGRRPMILGSVALGAVCMVPAYLLLSATSGGVRFLGLALMAVATAGVLASGAVGIPELWPPQSRYTGVGLTNQLALAVFGGTAPLVGDTLVHETGWAASPGLYAVVLGVIVLVLLAPRLPETRGRTTAPWPAEVSGA